nr:hypothetical protein [Tanacetum cinerariifolium]
SIAFFYFFDFKACSKLEGISSKQRLIVNAFTLLERFPPAMLAIGYLAPLVVFSGEYHFGGTPLLDLGGRTYFLGTSSSCFVNIMSGTGCSGVALIFGASADVVL